MSALSVLLSLLVISLSSLGAIISGLSEASSSAAAFGGLGLLFVLAPLVLVTVVVVVIVVAIVYYKRFLWEMTETDIHVYSGIIFKKQVHIPFARVQSIDFSAQLLERIIGIVKLKIETAGGASNKAVIIPALKLAEAEAFRAEVFARKGRAAQMQEAQMRQKMEAMRTAKAAEGAPMGVAAAVGAGAANAAGATAAAVGASVAATPVLVPAADGAMPRFDPQTGLPLPPAATAAAAAATAAAAAASYPVPGAVDDLVNAIGDTAGGLRGVFADNYSENAPIEHEHRLTAGQLMLSAISGDHHLVTLLVFVGLISQVGEFLNLLGLEETMDTAAQYVLDAALPIAMVSLAGFWLLMLALMILSSALQYGGFKALRRGGRIEVERGLITRQYRGVAISRVQSVQINQGFIRRLLGYAELKLLTIDSVSAAEANNQQAMQASGLVIHPFIKTKQIDGLLSSILPEFNGRPAQAEFRSLPKVALRRVINRHVVFFAVCYAIGAAALLVFWNWLAAELSEPTITSMLAWLTVCVGALFVLFLIGRSVAAVLWYRQAAYAYNASMITIRSGFFSLTTTIIPRQKIQWARIRQNPFQRFSKVASIHAVTAAGVGGTTTKLRDLAAEDASAYLDWVRPRGPASRL
jgi:putative membrane protein